MRATTIIYHQWLTVHDGNTRLPWKPVHSTWKCCIQSNQRDIWACVCIMKYVCCWLSEIHWETKTSACERVKVICDMSNRQKTRLTGQRRVEKSPERSNMRRKPGRREMGSNKSISELSPYSAALIYRQLKEYEGNSYVKTLFFSPHWLGFVCCVLCNFLIS